MTVSGSGDVQKPGAAQARSVRVALFDLDDCLYRNHKIPETVRRCIEEYMVQKLGVSEAEVKELTSKLYYAHGTTLCGLVASGYKVDYDDWHHHVHTGAIDYEGMLKPDARLREILMSMDVPKYLLTNADHKHALICLERLGISDCFQGIFDFERSQQMAAERGLSGDGSHPRVFCKPQPVVYKMVLETIGVQPSEAVFFDDSIRNLQSAHDMGVFTVLVGQGEVVKGANLALPDLHALPGAFPELIDRPGLVRDDRAAAASLAAIACEV